MMQEAAAQTEHILADPPPQIWQKDLGNYAVEYEFRAATDRPEAMFGIHRALCRNVLDAFNGVEVEIMTPSWRSGFYPAILYRLPADSPLFCSFPAHGLPSPLIPLSPMAQLPV
jgi:hypothetical protein